MHTHLAWRTDRSPAFFNHKMRTGAPVQQGWWCNVSPTCSRGDNYSQVGLNQTNTVWKQQRPKAVCTYAHNTFSRRCHMNLRSVKTQPKIKYLQGNELFTKYIFIPINLKLFIKVFHLGFSSSLALTHAHTPQTRGLRSRSQLKGLPIVITLC